MTFYALHLDDEELETVRQALIRYAPGQGLLRRIEMTVGAGETSIGRGDLTEAERAEATRWFEVFVRKTGPGHDAGSWVMCSPRAVFASEESARMWVFERRFGLEEHEGEFWKVVETPGRST